MHHVDTGHHHEQLAGHMGYGPVAGRRHAERARIGLGIGNELGEGVGWNRWIYFHDVGHAHARDRRYVADENCNSVCEQRRVDRIWLADHEKRVPVGRCFYDRLGTDVAAAPGRFSMTNC